jgi:hypothetical protein
MLRLVQSLLDTIQSSVRAGERTCQFGQFGIANFERLQGLGERSFDGEKIVLFVLVDHGIKLLFFDARRSLYFVDFPIHVLNLCLRLLKEFYHAREPFSVGVYVICKPPAHLGSLADGLTIGQQATLNFVFGFWHRRIVNRAQTLSPTVSIGWLAAEVDASAPPQQSPTCLSEDVGLVAIVEAELKLSEVQRQYFELTL